MEIHRGVRRLFPCVKLKATEQQMSVLMLGEPGRNCILEFNQGEKLDTPSGAVIVRKDIEEYMLYGYDDDVDVFLGTELPRDLVKALDTIVYQDLGTISIVSQDGEDSRVYF